MVERWLPVVGQEGRYEISDAGRVRSLARVTMRSNGYPLTVRGRILTGSGGHPSGHLCVSMAVGSKHHTHQVHRLVLAAFVGPCPDGMEVRHLNGDPTDNRVENLTYGTRAENILDQVAHGVHNKASLTECKRGHVFAPLNTYMNGSRRVCIECRKSYKRQWRKRRRDAGLTVH